jgi:hypothetical protein
MMKKKYKNNVRVRLEFGATEATKSYESNRSHDISALMMKSNYEVMPRQVN